MNNTNTADCVQYTQSVNYDIFFVIFIYVNHINYFAKRFTQQWKRFTFDLKSQKHKQQEGERDMGKEGSKTAKTEFNIGNL